jgi:hypothetical protein
LEYGRLATGSVVCTTDVEVRVADVSTIGEAAVFIGSAKLTSCD